jgi:hypothetical protein
MPIAFLSGHMACSGNTTESPDSGLPPDAASLADATSPEAEHVRPDYVQLTSSSATNSRYI